MNYKRKRGTVMGNVRLEPPPDSFHPDSLYWKRRAIAAIDATNAIIGDEACGQLFDEMWPGETIQEETWRSIYDGVHVIQDNWWKEQVNQQAADHADLDELRTACRNG